MNKAYIAIILILWGATLAAYAVPGIAAAVTDLWRSRGDRAALFILMVIAACIYAYPSSAEKSSTNEPPATPSMPAGTIRLYYEDGAGHLVPLGAPIEEAGHD